MFGSTGSIGRNALDVARHHPDRVEIVGLAANSRWTELAEQCREFQPRYALIADAGLIPDVDRAAFPSETTLLFGTEGVVRLATDPDIDLVVSAVVGAAGLMGTWAAIETGKTIALANKETLVVAGSLVMELAARRGVTILPVDSEHSAIRQALTGHAAADVEKVVLTASGGPFRGKTSAELANVSVEEALRHPTWNMGPKISVDSATMMNKALEVIEARWLFDLKPEQIDIIVHPASIVHSFVEFVDGSVLAQLSPPDMRLPIQLAMLHPDRLPGPAKKLNWRSLAELRFEPADRGTFPAIDLGFEVARRGGTTGAVLNAANEAAVARFLAGELKFLDIARCCRAVLDSHDFDPSPTLAGLLAADRRARQEVSRWTSP
ncbi:MAG: 1-deoxy-D-xylulose-5-phosphate reductoisomerase [Gemmataceae bacterium]|nr:1-deoxy-D-xylulose-5-phosphate reductoisomerase [Gemmataceae bacterium]